jgi:hypothetical protein
VPRIRLRVHWSVSSAGRGADDIENTVSSIVPCWTLFTELLPSNALIKSVTILSTHPRLGLPSGLFPSGFSTNILYALLFYPIRAICHANLIHLDLIILRNYTWNYEALHYTVFSNLPSLYLPSVQIFSSGPRSQTLVTEFRDRVGGTPGSYSEFAGYFDLETGNIKCSSVPSEKSDPRPLPSTSIPIHYSAIILPFDAIYIVWSTDSNNK